MHFSYLGFIAGVFAPLCIRSVGSELPSVQQVSIAAQRGKIGTLSLYWCYERRITTYCWHFQLPANGSIKPNITKATLK